MYVSSHPPQSVRSVPIANLVQQLESELRFHRPEQILTAVKECIPQSQRPPRIFPHERTHSPNMAQINYRTINIDVLDPESSINFPMDTLLPGNLPEPTNSGAAASVAQQVRQLLRGGDPEGALKHVLDTAPLGGDAQAKEVHLATVIDVLQGIRQGEMLKVLEGVISGEGGTERADCLMKYMCVLSSFGRMPMS